MTIDLKQLKADMPYKWKPNNAMGKKMNCVAYVDSRQVQDKLDDVCGPQNWQDDYKVINGNMYAGVGINVSETTEDPQWVWKWDCGTESNTEKEKGESSDAFKRAAVKWGVGRFLYTLDMVLLDQKEYNGRQRTCDKSGKILWTGDDITKYINNMNKAKQGNYAPKQPSTEHVPTPGRYNADKGGAGTTYSNNNVFSPQTITAVKKLSRDGKKGKDVLKAYIPAYNIAKKTDYSGLGQFNTDVLINNLIEFVEKTPPTNV